MEHLKQLANKYITKNKAIIVFVINLYLVSLGSFWIIIFLYFRLFQQRKEYMLIEIKMSLSPVVFKLFVLFVLIHFTILLNISLTWYRERYNKKPNSFLTVASHKLSIVVDVIYWKPLDFIYKKIEGNIPGSGRFFLSLEHYWTSTNKNKYYSYFIIFVLEVLPRIIMAFAFFIDIIIYNQLKYFLYVISLIFIPILFKIFLKLLESFHDQNIGTLTNYFSIIQGQGTRFYNEDSTMVFYEKYHCELKDEYVDVVDLNEEFNNILQLKHILMYVYGIRLYINRIMLCIIFFTSSLYFIAGVARIIILIT